METLPDRLYGGDVSERQRFLPYGRRHPAKMNLALLADLIRRYTLPGQTWLDPFFGVGSTGTAVLTGRSVVGIELEAHHAADAGKNILHLARYAKGGATATVLQGDSRKLRELLSGAGVGALTSPPYHEAIHQNYSSQALADEKGIGREYGLTPGNIGACPSFDGTDRAKYTPKGQRGAPSGAVMSPPYGDVAKRDRSEEPYASKDPERAAKYGQDSPSRNIDGYGKDGAQIGNLPMGTLSSPPYANANTETGGNSGARGADAKRRAKQDYTTYEHPENLGNLPIRPEFLVAVAADQANDRRETYLDAVREVYASVFDVTPPGGVLVLVTGNYVREGKIVDLAAHTIAVCMAVGWTPVERWQAKKQNVSFWRRLHARKGLPLIDWEDVLVFAKGSPGWDFAELPPQRVCADTQPMLELSA